MIENIASNPLKNGVRGLCVENAYTVIAMLTIIQSFHHKTITYEYYYNLKE